MNRPLIGFDSAALVPPPAKLGGRFQYVVAGRVVEIDTLVMAAQDWEASPLRNDPAWSPLSLGGGSVMLQRLTV